MTITKRLAGYDGQGNPIWNEYGIGVGPISSQQTAWFNVWDYYDASQDDGAHDPMINRAIAAAVAAGGGTVYLPAGVYNITAAIILFNYIHLRGDGISATTLRLAPGANCDVLHGTASSVFINLAAAQNTGSHTGGANNWSIEHLTVDGNKANQGAGPSYCLRVYGYGHIVNKVRFLGGYSGGVLLDWNGATGTTGDDSMEAHWSNFKIHDCNGIGLEMGGPHDSVFSHFNVYNTGSHGVHIAPNASACVFFGAHPWGPALGVSAVPWLIEAPSCEFVNCEAEGSDSVQAVILGNSTSWIGGRIFAAGTFTVVGMQLGQAAGVTPYPGQILQSGGLTTAVNVSSCRVDTTFNECRNGAIGFNNEGNNYLTGKIFQTAGSVFSGGPAVTDIVLLSSHGIATDGTPATSGLGRIYSGANNALDFRAPNGSSYFNFNLGAATKRFELPQGSLLRMYSDNFATQTLQLGGGTVNYGQSATAAATATGGTITSAGVGLARVAPVGAITGVILQAGTVQGQQVIVVNESAFSITFAAASSNVADGSSDVIPATSARAYVWDNGTNLWYRLA